MVQALLDGNKTQTRRVVKFNQKLTKDFFNDKNASDSCPYGAVGDLLWVRETFAEWDDGPVYKTCNVDGLTKWKPLIFMPRHFSRLTLEIIDVKIERLLDISEEEAMAEGVEKLTNEPSYRNYVDTTIPCGTSKGSFKSLWQSINGKESLNSNPWVWALSFKVHKINIDNYLEKNKNEVIQ